MLTNHLNTVDDTGSIAFTHEKESEGLLPFLDTLLVRNEDGSVKLLVYRKKTHRLTSTWTLIHTTSSIRRRVWSGPSWKDVIRLCQKTMDRTRERKTTKEALTVCRYSQWAKTSVQNKIAQRQEKTKKAEKKKG